MTVLPLTFYLMMGNEKFLLPLMFYFLTGNKKRQCYPLRFIRRRAIKNDSFTPYVLFDKKKVLPLMFYLMTADKKQHCYPLCFI